MNKGHVAAALGAAMFLGAISSPFAADGLVYFRMNGGAGTAVAPQPPSPFPDGRFGILVQGAPQVQKNEKYTAQVFVYNAEGRVDFSVAEGALPPGTSLGPSSGIVSGAPTIAGRFQATLAARDASTNTVATGTLAIEVAAPLEIVNSAPAVARVGRPYHAAFTANGGDGSYTFSSSSLPTGLTMTASADHADIFGEPAEAGNASIVVTAHDGHGRAAVSKIEVTIAPPPPPVVVAGTPPIAAYEDATYTAAFSASGGTGMGFVYAATGLPPGLSMDPTTGQVSGVPQAGSAGAYGGIMVSALDNEGDVGQAGPFSITVNIPPLAMTQVPAILSAPLNQPYAGYQFAATGGSRTGYSFALLNTGARIPAGMTLDAATGWLVGTPTQYNNTVVMMTVTDRDGRTARSNAFTIFVSGPLLLTGGPVPSAKVETAYNSVAGTAKGGALAGYRFSLADGALPPGLTLADNGTLVGTPTTEGTWTGTFQVTDAAGAIATGAPFSIEVAPANDTPPLVAELNGFPTAAAAGSFLWFPVTLYGGYGGPYVVSEDPNHPLPTGLTLTQYDEFSAVIQGSIGDLGIYPLAVKVVDASQTPTLTTFSDPVNLVIVPMTVNLESTFDGNLGTPFYGQYSVTGNVGNVTYFISAGHMPNGLALDSATGTVSGTPSEAGRFLVAVGATDQAGKTAATALVEYRISPPDGPCYATGSIGPGAEVGNYIMSTPISLYFGMDGSTPGRTLKSMRLNWADAGHDDTGTGAPLPPGVKWVVDKMAGTGMLSGQVSETGVWGPISVTIEDEAGGAGSCGTGVVVGPFWIESVLPVKVATTALPDATSGTDYNAAIEAVDGRRSATASGYWFAINVDEQMPPGLFLDPESGAVSGTALAPGSYTIHVTATDVWGYSDTAPVTLKIRNP